MEYLYIWGEIHRRASLLHGNLQHGENDWSRLPRLGEYLLQTIIIDPKYVNVRCREEEFSTHGWSVVDVAVKPHVRYMGEVEYRQNLREDVFQSGHTRNQKRSLFRNPCLRANFEHVHVIRRFPYTYGDK